MTTPQISQDPMYLMLRDDNVAGFNQARESGKSCDLTGCDLRGLDLRKLNVSGMDLTDTPGTENCKFFHDCLSIFYL